MIPPAPFDLAPVGALLAIGALLALGPLTWLRLRNGPLGAAGWLRGLTWVTLFLTFDLVLFGAFTRLSDSGLGCPDWPGCYASASPFGAGARIDLEQRAMPTGPVTHVKAWIEMVHRYFATGVGALIALLAVLNWRAARRGVAGASPRWALLTLVWVCMQGAFGALTVTMKLYPAIVALHLLGGIGLLVLLTIQAQAHAAPGPGPGAVPPPPVEGVMASRASASSTSAWSKSASGSSASSSSISSTSTSNLRASGPRTASTSAFDRSRPFVMALWLLAVLGLVQIALGAWVSTNYAVLACRDFPTCQGAWWPPMDFARGFQLRRELGFGADGSYLPFAALTAIHVAHRLGAAVVLAAIALLAWRLRRSEVAALRRLAVALGALGLWQLASGIGNVVLGWPLAAAGAHTGGAAALAVVLTLLTVRINRNRQAAVATSDAAAAAERGRSATLPASLPS